MCAAYVVVVPQPADELSARALEEQWAEHGPDVAAHGGGPRRRLQEKVVPDISRTLNTASDCTGWLPSKRMYIESQAWFTQPGQDIDTESSHLHIGACMPQKQRVYGDVTFHILIMKHQLAGGSRAAPVSLSLEFSTVLPRRTTAKYTVKGLSVRDPNAWTCNAGNVLCRAVLPVMVKTWAGTYARPSVPDGFTTLTIQGSVSFSDGKRTRGFTARAISTFMMDNRQKVAWPERTYNIPAFAIASFPWGYTHAQINSDYNYGPVPKIWRFSLSQFVAGSAARTSNVTRVFVSVNPNFHNTQFDNFQGQIILANASVAEMRAACPLWAGQMTPRCNYQLELDTTRLDRGIHKLFIRTDSDVLPDNPIMTKSKANAGIFSAITLIGFTVCNSEDRSLCDDPPSPPPDERPVIQDYEPITAPIPGTGFYKEGDVLPPVENAIEVPYDCSAWRGRRAYIEGQTWFTPEGQDPTYDSAQLSVGACLPHKSYVAGVIPIDVAVGKFNMRFLSGGVSVRFAIVWLGGNITFELRRDDAIKSARWVCADASKVCKQVWRAKIHTRPESGDYYIPDGLCRYELWGTGRMWDGVINRTVTARTQGFFIIANNMATFDDFDPNGPMPPHIKGMAEFPWEHTQITLNTGLPVAPINAKATLSAGLALTGGSDGVLLTGGYVAVDPILALKPADPGWVLWNVQSAGDGSTVAAPPAGCRMNGNGKSMSCSISLDPAAAPQRCALNPCSKGLCDGRHRLVIRLDSFVPAAFELRNFLAPEIAGAAGTLSTVLIVPFETMRGVAPDACGAGPSGSSAGLSAMRAPGGAPAARGEAVLPAAGAAPGNWSTAPLDTAAASTVPPGTAASSTVPPGAAPGAETAAAGQFLPMQGFAAQSTDAPAPEAAVTAPDAPTPEPTPVAPAPDAPTATPDAPTATPDAPAPEAPAPEATPTPDTPVPEVPAAVPDAPAPDAPAVVETAVAPASVFDEAPPAVVPAVAPASVPDAPAVVETAVPPASVPESPPVVETAVEPASVPDSPPVVETAVEPASVPESPAVEEPAAAPASVFDEAPPAVVPAVVPATAPDALPSAVVPSAVPPVVAPAATLGMPVRGLRSDGLAPLPGAPADAPAALQAVAPGADAQALAPGAAPQAAAPGAAPQAAAPGTFLPQARPDPGFASLMAAGVDAARLLSIAPRAAGLAPAAVDAADAAVYAERAAAAPKSGGGVPVDYIGARAVVIKTPHHVDPFLDPSLEV